VRVLVAHGSEHGGTAGLGRMIAEAFVARGIPADVGDAAEVDDLSLYDVVVLGGALYNDRWHPDAREFAERNASTLSAMPVWLFSTGPLDDSARLGAIAPVEGVRRLANRLDVNGHMTFGGVLRAEDTTYLDRIRRRRPGDYRSREQVEEWVVRILARLAAPPTRRLDATDEPPDEGLSLLSD
jgi:menaquinone-dependent protoporphyrinogen oxidase